MFTRWVAVLADLRDCTAQSRIQRVISQHSTVHVHRSARCGSRLRAVAATFAAAGATDRLTELWKSQDQER
jgi:hypothetical protein